MKKKVLAAIILAMGLLVGCGQEPTQSPIIEVTPAPIATATPAPEATPEVSATTAPETNKSSEMILIDKNRTIVNGKMQSYLTGEWKDAAVVQRRNIAVMIPNNKPAMPQYGLSLASVIYEAPTENGTNTRLMALFEDYDGLDRIGPVRSSRDYYVYEAMSFDSIYINWGLAVPYVAPIMEDKRIDHISQGVSGQPRAYGYAFDRFDRPGYSTEFTGYLIVDRVAGAIKNFGYDTNYDTATYQPFKFADSEIGARAEYANYPSATKIIPGGNVDAGSGYQEANAYFEYNANDGLYYRYQHGAAQCDEYNGEQLAVSNVIFKVCYGERRDEKGYLAFQLHGTGDAYVFTNGKVIKGTWQHNSDYEHNVFLDANGQEIVLNQGKTWICNIWSEYQDCMKWN